MGDDCFVIIRILESIVYMYRRLFDTMYLTYLKLCDKIDIIWHLKELYLTFIDLFVIIHTRKRVILSYQHFRWLFVD